VLVALVVVLAMAAAAGGWYLGVGRFTTTPDVRGETRAEAQAMIEAAGLSFEVDATAFSDEVPEGAVISTDPAPDARILKGDEVSAVVSKGEERYAVPQVIDMTVDEAEAALGERRLEARPVERYTRAAEAGVVFDTSIRIGREVPPGTSVTIFVSLGPRPIEIPDTTDVPYDEARAQLKDRGFRVPEPQLEYSTDVPAGVVISQSPDGGTGFRRDTIELVVSQGPPLAEVPSVVYSSPGEAREELREAGFRVRTRHDDSYVLGLVVIRQDPGAGAQAPLGSAITIYVV